MVGCAQSKLNRSRKTGKGVAGQVGSTALGAEGAGRVGAGESGAKQPIGKSVKAAGDFLRTVSDLTVAWSPGSTKGMKVTIRFCTHSHACARYTGNLT